MCGENFDIVLIDCAPAGSSPRVRGKQHLFEWKCDACGLIPARAGKTAIL